MQQARKGVTVSGPLAINDPSALVTAAIEHAGVLLIDKGLLGDTIDQGKLVPLMTGYKPIGGFPIYAIFPEKEFMPAKTRVFIDFLLEEMPAKLSH